MADIGIDLGVRHLGHCLEEYGKTLNDYGLPEPVSYGREIEHKIAHWNVNPTSLVADAQTAYEMFNAGQQTIYDDIINAMIRGDSLQAFVDGKAGRGKTTLVNAICQKVRSLGRIVLP